MGIMMSVEADLSEIKNSDLICWEYSKPSKDLTLDDGWEPTGDGLVMRMSPKTTGIIMASAEIHLNHISPTNLLEWIYRLECFFDAGKSYMDTMTKEGPVPIRLTLHDLRDHIGLRTNVRNWTKTRFDSRVREIRIVRHLEALGGDM